jgi:hypothetical protein
MAVNLSPVGGVAAQFFTSTGAVLTGGKLYTYAAGTTTPVATYTTSQGTTAWSNPVVLDAAGRVPGSGEIWLTDGVIYKFVLKDSNDVLIATYDNITGINSNAVAYTNQQEIVTATAGQTVFNLGISYAPGTNSLSVFVDGVNQYGPGAQYAYTETSSTSVTFNSGLHVGAEVKFTTTQQQGAGAVDASQVTYDPPFTGSVATNVEAKLAQTVSVKDFGAVGDGVTDDTAAIQAALNSGAGAVYMPTGTYSVSDQLDVISCSLYGDGPASEIIFTGLSGNVIETTGYVKRSISNLKISNSSNVGIGVNITDAIGVTVSKVIFSTLSKGVNFTNSVGGFVYGCSIENCEFTDNSHAIFMAASKQANIINITDNLINVLGGDAAATGISCYGNDTEINITGNIIQGGDGRAIVIDGSGSAGFHISNNWMEFSGGALTLPIVQIGTTYDIKNVTITNNISVRTTYHPYAIGGTGKVYNAVIQNNYFDGNIVYAVAGVHPAYANIIGGIVSENFITNVAASGQVKIQNTATQPTHPDVYIGSFQVNNTIGVGTAPATNGVGLTFNGLPNLSTNTNTLDDYREIYELSSADVGFSGTAPSGYVGIVKTGNMVTVTMPAITGTSNSASFIFAAQKSIFQDCLPASTRYAPVRVQNNGGSYQWGMISVATDGTLNVYLNANADGFTTSGTKSLAPCSFSYTIQ